MHDCMTGVIADQENQENTKVTKTPGKKQENKQSPGKKEKQDQENRIF